MKIIPFNGKILAKKVESKKETSGLILPDSNDDIYEVIDASYTPDGAIYVPGDRIIVDKYDALEKIINKEKFYFINYDRVLAKIE